MVLTSIHTGGGSGGEGRGGACVRACARVGGDRRGIGERVREGGGRRERGVRGHGGEIRSGVNGKFHGKFMTFHGGE